MFVYSLVFLLGSICLHTASSLWSVQLYKWLLIFLGSVFCYTRSKKNLYWSGFKFLVTFFFIFGYLWTGWYAAKALERFRQLPVDGNSVIAAGRIASFVKQDGTRSEFEFSIETIGKNKNQAQLPVKVKVSWYHPNAQPKMGQVWQFPLRLKRVRGLSNPGGLDYERLAWSKRIAARATVVNNDDSVLVSTSCAWSMVCVRGRLWQVLDTQLQGRSYLGVIQALVLGIKESITESQWQVFRDTGTSHLLAISGLHVGLIAGLGNVLGLLVSRLWPQGLLIIPAARIGAVFGFIFALVYSALAGFTIPTQRALIMVGVFFSYRFWQRSVSLWHVLGVSLWWVVLLDPLAPLSPGLYLSFFAVSWIAWIAKPKNLRQSKFSAWWGMQWRVMVGLAPLTLYFFQQFSLISVLANAVAIPFYSFFVVPMALLATMTSWWQTLSQTLFFLVDKGVSVSFWFMEALSRMPFSVISISPPSIWSVACSLWGSILLTLPSGFRVRHLGWLWFLPLLVSTEGYQAKLQVTFLDVGQGLSIFVKTAKHSLVYDTGPSYKGGLDMGKQVVLPYLRSQGVTHLDRLIISHADNDHIGGARSLVSQMNPPVWGSFFGEILGQPIHYCEAGESWQWDGVIFTFLHPKTMLIAESRNNQSCVLRISMGDTHILLTGDIEILAEKKLLRMEANNLPATLMLSPHHGSKTSSSIEFVRKVTPKFTVVSSGFQNRFGFPHDLVMKTYDSIGTKVFNTANDGAVTFYFGGKKPIAYTSFRQLSKHYWSF